MLIVDGLAVSTPYERSNASRPKDRREEDTWAAMEALEKARQMKYAAHHGTWQAWVMCCVKPIAAYYQVDVDDVLTLWGRHYGPSLALEQG